MFSRRKPYTRFVAGLGALGSDYGGSADAAQYSALKQIDKTNLTAVDLNEGTIKWQVPLGTDTELAAKGIKNTGEPRQTIGGPVATAGGLIFVGLGPEHLLHAYDKDTGKLLWEKAVDGNPKGIPAVYKLDGRQYVAFLITADGPGSRGSQGYSA